MSIAEEQIGKDFSLYGYGLDDPETKAIYDYMKSKFVTAFYYNVAQNEIANSFVIERGNPEIPAVYYGPDLIGGLDNLKMLLADIEDGWPVDEPE